MAGFVHGQNKEKQVGCISGFFQIFDRQQILAGKRIHSTKRLPPATGVGASPETISVVNSPEFCKEPPKQHRSPSENANDHQLPPPLPNKSTPLNPANKSSLTSSKEMPRFSLDSRGTTEIRNKNGSYGNPTVADGGGDDNQRRSPSVIARLMGLEPLSNTDKKPPPQTEAKLTRSVSESRVSRDLIHSKYIDDNNFQVKQPNQSQKKQINEIIHQNLKCESSSTTHPRKPQQQTRAYLDSGDIFLEPNQNTNSMHGGFEKKSKLKKRGMDEQCNDLGTLKQILEVLQLKGLLHSTKPSNRDDRRSYVYVRNSQSDESSIVLVKPWRSPATKLENHCNQYQRSSNGVRRYAGENSPAISPKQDGGNLDRSGRNPARGRNCSPTRIESNLKKCNSIVKRKPLRIEIERRDNESSNSVRNSPINSPKLTPKRTNRSPRNQKPPESSAINSPKLKTFKNVVTEDESSSISTPSPTDTEGRTLLQRCDKLLSEMRNSTQSPPIPATVLPSPVSVLDSGFDSLSPTHSTDSKDPTVDFEATSFNRSFLQTKSTEVAEDEEFVSDDSDFIYISELLRVSQNLHEEDYSSVEKHLFSTDDSDFTSIVSKRRRKLVFDVIVEIVRRNRDFPPWKTFSTSISDCSNSLKQIWSEFQRIREVNAGEGLLELISGVLEKDLVGIDGWRDFPVEKSEAALDIERMIFKDLVSEAIGEFPAKSWVFSKAQRRLVF